MAFISPSPSPGITPSGSGSGSVDPTPGPSDSVSGSISYIDPGVPLSSGASLSPSVRPDEPTPSVTPSASISGSASISVSGSAEFTPGASISSILDMSPSASVSPSGSVEPTPPASVSVSDSTSGLISGDLTGITPSLSVPDASVTPSVSVSISGNSAGPISGTPGASTPGASSSPAPMPNAVGPYVGCFLDVSTYGLPLFTGPSFFDGYSLTLESCAAFCSSTGYESPLTYFGIQNGNTCKCGNTNPSISQIATTCDAACSGNSSQSCGGEYSDSVYEVAVLPVQITPGITPTSSLPVVSPSSPVTPSDSGSAGSVQSAPSVTPSGSIPNIASPTPDVSTPSDSAGSVQSTPGVSSLVSLPDNTAGPIGGTPGGSAEPIESTPTLSTPGAVPTVTRLPYPNRPPSEVGDGVDYPYFPPPGYYYPDGSDAGDGVDAYYKPGHHGYKPKPKPTQKPAYPTKPRPWKPRPTVKPWEGGNGYTRNIVRQRGWFGPR
ncbi:hypothetical protein G6514_007192 [Epicoccum nigrum]|nr:hypothetical protein G6514_007192 [Epicoccum nigrum]